MNTLPEEHSRDRAQRLRFLTPEQLGRSAAPRAPHPAFLFPSESDPLQQEQDLAAEKIAGLERRVAELEQELVVKTERSRREGHEAGRGKAAAEFERALAESRRELAASEEAFGEERRKYFRRVESEVVKLALAIARKILHREAQIDSALLTGIVRAALDRLEESSGAVLRVPAAEAGGWKDVLASLPKPPALVEDGHMPQGTAVLESQTGTIELSIDAQLQEIERGFFDLLHESPARAAGNATAAAAGRRSSRNA
jgi:flagellar assembly protein FliH